MKKAKLIACLSILPAFALTPAFLSSCSKTKSYTIMNLTATTYVAAAQNKTGYNVTLCNNVFVVDPDHKVVSIDTKQSTYTIEAPKNLITNVQIVPNAKNNTIGVFGKVNGWDGQPTAEGTIVLKLNLVLENGAEIECKTNILLRHDYRIYPFAPAWVMSTASDTTELSLIEGFDTESPITENVTWKVVSVPEEYEGKFAFNDQTKGILSFSGTTVPVDQPEIVISASIDDYVIEKSIWIIETT